MKKSIKIAITACLAGIMAIALAFGFSLINRSQTPTLAGEDAISLKGEYDNPVSLFSAGDSKAVDVAQDVTYTAYETKGKVSTDNQYLLIVVAIDDVEAYSSMGLSIKADGEELVTDFDGKTYYTSIKYADESTETSVDFYGEDNEDKGMLVFEVQYNADKAYRVTPSFTKTDSTTLYGQMKTTKQYQQSPVTRTHTETPDDVACVQTYTYGNDSYQVNHASHNFVDHECTYGCGTYSATSGLTYYEGGSGAYFVTNKYAGSDTTVVIPDKHTQAGKTLPTHLSSGNWKDNTIVKKIIVGNSAKIANSQIMFARCTNLQVIDISALTSITGLNASAFLNCTSLTTVYIPASITSINSGAFSGCTQDITIYFAGTQAQWNAMTSKPTADNFTIICSDGQIA